MGIFDEERGAREYLRDIERHKCQVDAIREQRLFLP